jgi:hypothetical protein
LLLLRLDAAVRAINPILLPYAESSINTASRRKRVSSFFAVMIHALVVR